MSFRLKLLLSMSLIAVAITGLALIIIERKVIAETEHDLELSFQAELDALHVARQIRQAALTERCRALVSRPRILATLEDDALDLLYSSARDELRDLMQDGDNAPSLLRAKFYRFLDRDGQVLRPGGEENAGFLTEAETQHLRFNSLPTTQQTGFLWHEASGTMLELFAVPIVSSETGEVISALVIGLAPSNLQTDREEMMSGIFVHGSLHFPEASLADQESMTAMLSSALAAGKQNGSFQMSLRGRESRIFFNVLNPNSLFSPACEVCIYPLTALLARQETLRWQAAGIFGVLLVSGVLGSQVLAKRLSKPVEKLAIDSADNLAKRQVAEAALEVTSQELQRSARFSADASHQLKTPVAVLRAGLDELLATENLSVETREEVSSLLHQTFRLNNIIEDLLLLSRMDSGRLKLNLAPVDLAQLIEGWLDDFSTLGTTDIVVETDVTGDNQILGEKRYTAMIVENLLDNARKYNRSGGLIKVSTRQEGESVILRVANNGRTIPAEIQGHIFERFHRGTSGENVPGYGLGLNLARELARLHGGELRLVSSQDDWTAFDVSFCPANVRRRGEGMAVA